MKITTLKIKYKSKENYLCSWYFSFYHIYFMRMRTIFLTSGNDCFNCCDRIQSENYYQVQIWNLMWVRSIWYGTTFKLTIFIREMSNKHCTVIIRITFLQIALCSSFYSFVFSLFFYWFFFDLSIYRSNFKEKTNEKQPVIWILKR